MSSKNMNTLVLYTGIIILINIILLSYILKLEREECDCSDKWMRDYIKYYSAGLIILSLLILVVPNVNVNKKKNGDQVLVVSLNIVRVVVLLATLVQVYSIFMYSQALNCKKKTCECSVDWRGRFMYWLGIFGFVIYAILVLGFLLCILVNDPRKCGII
mgnify:FL=1|jgi:hypothetical protein